MYDSAVPQKNTAKTNIKRYQKIMDSYWVLVMKQCDLPNMSMFRDDIGNNYILVMVTWLGAAKGLVAVVVVWVRIWE